MTTRVTEGARRERHNNKDNNDFDNDNDHDNDEDVDDDNNVLSMRQIIPSLMTSESMENYLSTPPINEHRSALSTSGNMSNLRSAR